MSNEPQVAVAFVVREKFGWALASLVRIYRFADVAFRLYFVDCGYPKPVVAEIDRFLADKDNVVRLVSPAFLLPNESLNLLLPRVTERYVCIVQNDVLVGRGFLGEQLATFARHGCDIVQPHTDEIDGETGAMRPHRHEYTDTGIVRQGGRLLVQVPAGDLPPTLSEVRRIRHFELHTLMLTTRAARQMSPLPAINSREHVDLAVHAHARDFVAYVNERARAAYVLPPIRDDDAEYFRFRWDERLALRSHELVMQRWRIANMPTAMSFVVQHRRFLDPRLVRRTAPDSAAWSEADIYDDANWPRRAPTC
ncbi:hypothetical protein BURK1_02148 [Burkholderiales bacterium]|nr:hypothetical protein BURK1_02148 [Burkholderiales bacterium]